LTVRAISMATATATATAMATETTTAKVTAMVTATLTAKVPAAVLVMVMIQSLLPHHSIVLHCQKTTVPTLTLHQTTHPQQTKPPAATAAPLTAVALEDDKDKQGVSLPLSPTGLTNIVKDIMGQLLALKIINNQQSESKGGKEDGRSLAAAARGGR
jgi:hypothetical protein